MAGTLRLPLALAPNGALMALEQDSPAELAQSLRVLLSTRVGERLAAPEFGSPDPRFGRDTAGIEAAIAEWEPRVDPQEFRASWAGDELDVALDWSTAEG